MEGASCDMVGTPFLQCHEVPYHINNLRGIQYLIHRFLRNHPLLLVYLSIDFIFIDGLLHLP